MARQEHKEKEKEKEEEKVSDSHVINLLLR